MIKLLEFLLHVLQWAWNQSPKQRTKKKRKAQPISVRFFFIDEKQWTHIIIYFMMDLHMCVAWCAWIPWPTCVKPEKNPPSVAKHFIFCRVWLPNRRKQKLEYQYESIKYLFYRINGHWTVSVGHTQSNMIALERTRNEYFIMHFVEPFSEL